MKQNCRRFVWAGVSVLVLVIVVTFSRAQGGGASPQVIASDLEVYSISAPSSATRGTPISVSDVTTNIGNAGAAQSVSDIYICTSVNSVSSSCKVSSHVVGVMAVGGSYLWAGSVTVPSKQPRGTNYYIVVANGNRQVVESNYNNNTNYVMIIIN